MIENWNPDMVAIEDIQLQKFTQQGGGEAAAVTTYKTLAHLQGVLKNYCYENGIPYMVVPPATWRNFSNVKGKTRTDRKKSAQLIIEKIYNVKVIDDIADAILIGRYAAAQQAQSEVIIF